jgi:hypothetical protein
MLLFVSVLGLLVFRITNSLELGDEVYNASFVDDWLKGGIATSTFLVLHQTAGLLSYPFAMAFNYATGSTDGLLVFLRILFLCGNLVAAASLYFFLHKTIGASCAFVAMLAMLSFIPSGAPTACYASWGSQFLTVALATLGCALSTTSSRQATMWYVISALAWSLMAVAYPPLAAATIVCLIILVYSAGHPAAAWRYGLLVVAVLAATAILVGWVLTWDRLRASFEFLAAFNGSGNLQKKIEFAATIFSGNPYFCLLLVLAGGIGIMRRYTSDRLTATLTAALLASLLLLPVFPAALLARSADAVMLATATGLGLLADLRSGVKTDEGRRVFAALYATSLCAALVTSATATVSIWCFMIGALPGAILAVASFGLSADARRHTALALAALVGVFLMTSLTLYSGEWPAVQERVRITWGPAKGLAVPPWEASLINMMRDDVNPMMKDGDTILVEGRYSGLGVLSPARTKALSIYMLHVQYTTDLALRRVAEFYSEPTNRPDVVVIYKDDSVRFYDPFGEHLTEWYDQVSTKPFAAGIVTIFRNKAYRDRNRPRAS